MIYIDEVRKLVLRGQVGKTHDIASYIRKHGKVRVARTENNEPLFCLADVCKILNLQTNKVKERINTDGWNTIPVIDSLGRTQNAIFINEPNLYKAVLQSRKPEAEAFTDWVCEEVLPSIRKHGRYVRDKYFFEVKTKAERRAS